MRRRFSTFFLTLTLVLGLIFIFIERAFLTNFQLSTPAFWIARFILGLMFITILWVPFVHWNKEEDARETFWDKVLTELAFNFLGYITLLMSFIFVREISVFILNFFINIDWVYQPNYAFALLVITLIKYILGSIQARRSPTIKRVSLSVDSQKASSLKNFKIIQISDLHISKNISKNKIKTIVAKINRENPNIIVMTGDIGDSYPEQFSHHVQILSGLKSSQGIFYVPGNHEYYWDAKAWITAIENIGAKALINENVLVPLVDGSHVQVAGIPDVWGGQFIESHQWNIEKAFEQQTSEPIAYKVLLSHQPSVAKKASQFNIDLQLSGHTHAGQFFPFTLAVKLIHKFSKGLYKVGNMFVYVNSGTGFWGPPLRIGTTSEITIFTWKSQS